MTAEPDGTKAGGTSPWSVHDPNPTYRQLLDELGGAGAREATTHLDSVVDDLLRLRRELDEPASASERELEFRLERLDAGGASMVTLYSLYSDALRRLQ